MVTVTCHLNRNIGQVKVNTPQKMTFAVVAALWLRTVK